MMRRARRTALLVAFSLLTSAATAYAECAWVLWEDMTQSKKTSTEPVRAYTAKQDCDRALADVLAEFKSSSVQTVTKDEKHQEAFVTTLGKTTIGYRYVCLPDTVDPRGPKGK